MKTGRRGRFAAIAIALVILNGFFPIVWIFLSSLKSGAELAQLPITYLPHNPTLSNYIAVFVKQPIGVFFGNSLIVGLLSTGLLVLVATPAAYAIARLRMPLKNTVLIFLITISMFPVISLMVPLYKIWRDIGILDTYWALVFPYAVLSLPVVTLVLVAFFQDIPDDIESAAMVDGASHLKTLLYIIVPLAAPGVFTAAILAFVNSWNEFVLALSLASSPAVRTLPVGITMYEGQYAFPWGLVSAALVVAMVPVAVVILLFQRRVISGITAGGVK